MFCLIRLILPINHTQHQVLTRVPLAVLCVCYAPFIKLSLASTVNTVARHGFMENRTESDMKHKRNLFPGIET